jgi:UDP-glucose 4-epimerase
MATTILVTGGAGYIGSHACVVLLEAGYKVVVLDNLSVGNAQALERVAEITGQQCTFVEGDVRDRDCLEQLFTDHTVNAVIHFAGLKAVGESVNQPLDYYDNNVAGTVNLLRAMEDNWVRSLVFSSSATVYGDPASVPIREDFPLSATNPYGRSKLMVEEILADWIHANPAWSIGRLRYFNPVGAHPSGLIGEDPQGTPNNLMPYVAQVAVGRQDKLFVFGDDYPTPDGTGVRDYIHVMGVSVLEMIGAFEKACGKRVPHEIVGRRPGDIAECWADPGRARELLGWEASRTVEQMCEDAWRWQSGNPKGYE